MALSKNKINEQGVTTTYHKLGIVSLYQGQLRCHIDSYVSQNYRKLESPADSDFLAFEISIEEEESMGIRQLAYKKIKECEEWSDATDC